MTVADVDPRFLAMLIAYEDKRFRSHHGIDPLALLRAAWQAIRNGRIVSGGSTLTMQVARLLEPRPARRFSDKLAEMMRAVQLERQLSKDEILNLYLTLAPYGGNIEGIARRLAGLFRQGAEAAVDRRSRTARCPSPGARVARGPTAGRTRRSRRATA